MQVAEKSCKHRPPFSLCPIFGFSFHPVLNPVEVGSFGKDQGGWGLHPPGSRAGLLLPLLAAPTVQAAFKQLLPAQHTPTRQLRAATKSIKDSTPLPRWADQVLSSPNLLFVMSSVLLGLVNRLDICVSLCSGLRFPYKAGCSGGGSPWKVVRPAAAALSWCAAASNVLSPPSKDQSPRLGRVLPCTF